MTVEQLAAAMMEACLTMSIAILIVLVLSRLVDKRYSARWKHAAWLMIAVRLLLPFPVQLPETPAAHKTDLLVQNALNWQEEVFTHAVFGPISDVTDTDQTYGTQPAVISYKKWAIFLWFTGTILFLCHGMITYLLFIRKARRGSSEAPSSALAIVEQVREELNIRRHITLRQSHISSGPLVYGLFKPTILLPREGYSPEELYVILRHEAIHCKRHDIEAKLLMLLVRGLYWFNPLVHFMATRFNETIEFVCDEAVTRDKGQRFKKRYMETILKTAERHHSSLSSLTTYYNGGHSLMKKRFLRMMESEKKKRGFGTLGAFAVSCLLLGSLVACDAGEPAQKPDKNLPAEENTTDAGTGNTDGSASKETADILSIQSEADRYPELEDLIIKELDIPKDDLNSTRYYYNHINLTDDSKEHIIVLVVGPYTSGSGGSTALIVEKDGGLKTIQELTLIQPPIIVSDHMTNGYKDLVVWQGGGGAEGTYVALTADDGKYTTVNEGKPLDGLDGITGKAIISDDLAKDLEEGKGLYLQGN